MNHDTHKINLKERNLMILKNFKTLPLLSMLFIFISANQLPPIGTHEVIGKVKEVEIEIKVQSPSLEKTPLQIVCLFEYEEGDLLNPPALPKELNGMVHVDEALKGLITQLRQSKKFEGKSLETLLLMPPKNTLEAEKLLLIGLGNRNDFKPEKMRMIGVVGMREALRLGVSSYSHASDLKDAGISSPTAEVARLVIQGAIEAYETQKYLKNHKASEDLTVKKITLLSGPAFFEDSKQGIKKAINELDSQSEYRESN